MMNNKVGVLISFTSAVRVLLSSRDDREVGPQARLQQRSTARAPMLRLSGRKRRKGYGDVVKSKGQDGALHVFLVERPEVSCGRWKQYDGFLVLYYKLQATLWVFPSGRLTEKADARQLRKQTECCVSKSDTKGRRTVETWPRVDQSLLVDPSLPPYPTA